MKKYLFIFLCFIAQALHAETEFQITCGPYLQNMGENEVTVLWVTNKKAVSWVEITPNSNKDFYAEEHPRIYQTSFGKKTIDTLHKIRITGLEKGTTYQYRICSQEVLNQEERYIQYGKIAATVVLRQEPLRFTTLDEGKNSVSFLVVNDIHANNTVLHKLVKDAKKEADLVVFNGDMLSDIRSEKHIFEGFMNEAIGSFASEIPMFYCRGNHENRGQYSTEFINYFPTNTGMPYYTFRQGPVFFIVLDSGEDKPDNDIAYFGINNFEPYMKQEEAWLKEVVSSPECKEAPYRIVIMHMPPAGRLWYGTLLVKKQFIPILNDAGIDLMLCGHLHKYIYSEKNTNDCKFPVIINSNVDALKVKVNESVISVEVQDTLGAKNKSFRFLRINR